MGICVIRGFASRRSTIILMVPKKSDRIGSILLIGKAIFGTGAPYPPDATLFRIQGLTPSTATGRSEWFRLQTRSAAFNFNGEVDITGAIHNVDVFSLHSTVAVMLDVTAISLLLLYRVDGGRPIIHLSDTMDFFA